MAFKYHNNPKHTWLGWYVIEKGCFSSKNTSFRIADMSGLVRNRNRVYHTRLYHPYDPVILVNLEGVVQKFIIRQSHRIEHSRLYFEGHKVT